MRVTTNNQRDYNTPSMRVCSACNLQKPLNQDHFHKDKSRQYGYQYSCKECESKRKKGKDYRTERYKNLSSERKEQRNEISRKYYRTAHGRAMFLVRSYKRIDAKKGQVCDLTVNHMVLNIMSKPCIYCELLDENIGCDRVDNNQGHTISNTVPCCPTCNMARSDKFTFDEMLILGETIRKIKEMRLSFPDIPHFQRRLPK